MFEKFTERARKVMGLARQEAQRLNSEFIGTEHILLGIIQEGGGVAAKVLKNLQVDLKRIRQEIEKLITPSTSPTVTLGQLPFSPRAKRVIELASEAASQLGHDVIGTEHLLLGLLKENEGIAAQVLTNLGLKLDEVRDMVLEVLGADMQQDVDDKLNQKASKSKTPALDAFGRDLIDLAKEHKLDPVIGRRKEIERVMQILSRRTKNNPVLLGEAGVGKTAIVEGLAQDIINGNVPEVLKDKRLVVLDLALMVAGTKYRGQFEERIKSVMNEVRRAKNIILFIDELHTLVGAGGAEGAIDAANVLKPALSRGEIQCIGATTLDEYRKYIEKDAALERRFQTIVVDPPNRDESLEIMKGLRDKYEAHHRVRYTDEALEACVDLSTRYINGRFLPDKAIDVMDEAGARVRLQSMVSPPNIKELESEIKKLEKEKDEAISLQEFERAAQMRDKAMQLKRNKDTILKEWREQNKEFDGVVDAEVISQTVSMMTGIPLARIEKKEAERLLHLEDELHRIVISQDEAVGAISRAIRRSRAGLKDPRRPIGSFVFLGPTGVGKTLMAKALAKIMFGEEDALIMIDMSEYMEKHNVSRLIGAPPGYVGYEEGGQLTEKIRRRGYSVVLFDEIEKAHSDVFNMLLQIMEEGRLTDSFGRHVDFRNTILIMTSNIGADVLKNQTTLGFKKVNSDGSYQAMKEMLTKEVEKHFRPEFLNRLDDVIVFRPLSREDLTHIIRLEMKGVEVRIAKKGIRIELTPEATEYLIDQGYNPDYGARPLKRAIERLIEDPLSESILRGEFLDAKEIKIRLKDKHLFFDPVTSDKKDKAVTAEEKK
ncbi:MAG TPA: ATP-dependent Clp protease ATP-binding subunit [Planctomycetota bacterium]